MKRVKTSRGKTLGQFAVAKKMDRRRAACKICQLPTGLRKQLSARSSHVTVAIIVEWLKTEWGFSITAADYVSHARACHDVQRRRSL